MERLPEAGGEGGRSLGASGGNSAHIKRLRPRKKVPRSAAHAWRRERGRPFVLQSNSGGSIWVETVRERERQR